MNKIKIISIVLVLLMAAGCTPEQAVPSAVRIEESFAPLETPASLSDTLEPVELSAPIVADPQLFLIHFINSLDGWGVTETEVVRTNDGGETWHNVTPAGLTDVGYSAVSDFLDSSHAWLLLIDPNNFPFGGTLYATADGGATWSSVATPFGGGYMKFLDANNGWVMADFGSGAGSMAVGIYQTTDGGTNWTRTFTNDPNDEGASDTLPLGGIKQLFVPLNMDTAWIGGVVYETGTVYLYRTDEGGNFWYKINLELPEEANNGELSVLQVKLISDTQGFLAVRFSTTDKTEILLFFTNDAGTTWTLAPQRLTGSGFVDAPSATEVVYYSDGQFQVTTDAANTFETIEPDTSFGDSVLAMSFVSASTGWVLTFDDNGHRSLYRTTDGSKTWFALIP